MMAAWGYACQICDETGVHTHESSEVKQVETVTTYRVEQTGDRELICETHDREWFAVVLRGIASIDPPRGLSIFKEYTITVTTVTSGDHAPSAAWDFIR